MMKRKFYEYVYKYLMEMEIDIETYDGLRESTLRALAVQAALECRSMFEYAWDTEECYQADEQFLKTFAPDLEDNDLKEKLQVLAREREEWVLAHA